MTRQTTRLLSAFTVTFVILPVSLVTLFLFL